MSFQIEVLKVRVEPKGKYRVAIVDHKVGGKVDSKPLVSFGAGKAAFDVLSQAQQGDIFDIDSQKIKNEKDGKDYWTWVQAVSVGKSDERSSGAKASPRSTYETPDERAARQVYIVRQSSIANAIAFFELVSSSLKDAPDRDDIIAVAKVFEAYVFGNEPAEVE